ncbi:MAG: DUF1223 domain-containing protein [Rhodobacteraceae bacterium]|nr:DUF1223 domain-containing protein [Paracoccaceae bacterium]
MRVFLLGLMLMLVQTATSALADDRRIVVELFTSQGCSSCPKADRFITELAGRDDVIALALHVEYWDYLGWKDEFASEVHSLRQRGYAAAAHSRTIYTPQFIVQGGIINPESFRDGAFAGEVKRLVRLHAGRPEPVRLEVERSGGMLAITVTAGDDAVGPAVIHVVRYMPEQTIRIRGGENAGREITYSNIVTSWKALARWSGRGRMIVRTEAAGSNPVVVLVQADNHGPILAARELR